MKFYNLLICLIIIFIISCKEATEKQLPIYNPSNFNPELVDPSLKNKTEYHTTNNFQLINQNGDTITQDNYKDKIYVADFFFTRCGTICPLMTSNMQLLQQEFLNDIDVMFLSISVTPELDSISVLKDYAVRKGVNDSKWNITTGNKKHIYSLARKSYFAVVEQGDGGLQDFIHTPNFILVDTKKQIRGIYNGTSVEDIAQIIEDIRILRH